MAAALNGILTPRIVLFSDRWTYAGTGSAGQNMPAPLDKGTTRYGAMTVEQVYRAIRDDLLAVYTQSDAPKSSPRRSSPGSPMS